jgi:ribosomal protein L11 methylase PrmA
MTATYDLILANIYLEVLKNYQVDLKRLLKAEGYLLISGLTADQDEAFREAFTEWDYKHVEPLGNWKSYLLKPISF